MSSQDTMRRTVGLVIEAAQEVSDGAEEFYQELREQGLDEFAGGVVALIDGFKHFADTLTLILFEELAA